MSTEAFMTRERVEEIATAVYEKDRFPNTDEVWYNLYWLSSFAQAIEQAVRQSPEVQARQWQPIETAPKDGTEIIVFHPEGGVCAAFCPADGFAWHCMDGANTIIGKKSGQSIPRMTAFLNSPTHWMPLPAPPQQ